MLKWQHKRFAKNTQPIMGTRPVNAKGEDSMNKLKLIGYLLTGIGLIVGLGQDYIDGKNQEREIEEKVNEAVDKKFKERES